ncbi:MAG: CHAT domain-containing protein [Crocosphaera sp.]
MDEQRTQQYLKLINQLLTCNEGDEPRILEENQEFLDQGLIKVMIAEAQQLAEAGREIEANWLSFKAQELLTKQISQEAGFSTFVSKSDNALSSTPTPDYFDPSDHDFLMEVLQRIQKNPTPEYIYPLLENNISRLNSRYLGSLLKKWSIYKFSEVSQQEAQDIAGVIWSFGVLINQFEKGNKEGNQELAIIAYSIALERFTLDKHPKNRAKLQYNLGNSYQKRIKGNKADNLEKALSCYQEALRVYNEHDFSTEWAFTQSNIAGVYAIRFKDDRAENLEKAIDHFQQALQVLTQNNQSYYWGIIHNNLSAAYQNRVKGNLSVNLDYALVCCQNALQIFTIQNHPYEWAETQYNLGSIYQNQIIEDQPENLEKALKAYKNALQVFTYQDFPYQWAECQYSLALVYLNRRGDKLENLNQALNCCHQALRIYTPKNLVYDWADIQQTIGNIYSQVTHDTESIQHAIKAYQYALRIFTIEKFPRKCYQNTTNLGNLYYSVGNWKYATETYQNAIEVVETIRLETFNPQRRQEIISDAINVYYDIVQAYLNLNQPEKALEYIERSKGRNLVEFMTQKAIQPQNVSQEIIDKLAELKQQVVNEQIRLQNKSINQNLLLSDNLTPYVQDQSYLSEYQQELDDFIEKEITPHDENFQLTQKVQTIPFKDIKDLTDDSTCLLQWYMTGEKILAFIVSANEDVKVWQSSEEDRKNLLDTLNNYLQLYYSKKGKKEWIDKLPNLLQNFADILHINKIISLIPETCQRLMIIPHWFLHILPLHALPIDDNCILQDKYDIQYAPSCQLLQITKQRPLHQLTNLFAIQNPTEDLIFTDLEVNIISTLFNKKEIIAKDKAKKSTVTTQIKASESHCYHFSCHGSFNPDNPLESALLLAKPDQLTLGEIFELNLKKSRLVVLSACETGLIDLTSISDEYIGLPAGFLFAGSSSVVSSLWTVSDLSTSFLMMRFYEIILDKNQNISIPVALKMAQDCLRNLTVKEYRNTLNNCNEIVKQNQQKLTEKELSRLTDLIEDEQDRIKGFEHNYQLFNKPFYWAAFTASGI